MGLRAEPGSSWEHLPQGESQARVTASGSVLLSRGDHLPVRPTRSLLQHRHMSLVPTVCVCPLQDCEPWARALLTVAPEAAEDHGAAHGLWGSAHHPLTPPSGRTRREGRVLSSRTEGSLREAPGPNHTVTLVPPDPNTPLSRLWSCVRR